MTYYVGILDGKNDVWGVRIPDLEGCYGGGASTDAAINDATSAVREWAEHKRGRGAAIPAPRSIDEIKATEGFDVANEVIVMIPLFLDAGRTVRANLTMDAGLLEAIDVAATQRGVTRSAFIASAARERIEGRR